MMNKKLFKPVLWVFVVCMFIAGGLGLWVISSTLQPESVQPVAFISESDAPILGRQQPLKVLNWNVQFMAGNAHNHFFFDDGKDSWPAEKVLLDTLDAAAVLIAEEDPDVILLQEVDDGAKRTYYQDQLALLLERLPGTYKAQASTFYWQANFLPLPDLWGSVGMKMSIISKYKIVAATRYALAPIATNSLLEQQFQPRRAVLHAELETDQGERLHVLNTHFSAFAQGTNTMTLQVEQVLRLMQGFEERGEYAILGGDFNLIPHRKAYRQLSNGDQHYYNPQETELKPMFEHFASVPSLVDLNGSDGAAWYTHSPNKNRDKTPNKTLDYFFMTRGVSVSDARVRSDSTALPISDHMPLIATFHR